MSFGEFPVESNPNNAAIPKHAAIARLTRGGSSLRSRSSVAMPSANVVRLIDAIFDCAGGGDRAVICGTWAAYRLAKSASDGL